MKLEKKKKKKSQGCPEITLKKLIFQTIIVCTLFEPSLSSLGAVILYCVVICSHEAESSPLLPFLQGFL